MHVVNEIDCQVRSFWFFSTCHVPLNRRPDSVGYDARTVLILALSSVLVHAVPQKKLGAPQQQRPLTVPGHHSGDLIKYSTGRDLLHRDRSPENVLVATVSGTIYYLDGASGNALWSFQSGGPTFTSSYAPIIPSLNGSIYFFSDRGLKKHPLSVREIVANAPFAYGDGNIYLGSKTSHLYAIDPTTGEVFNCHTSPTTTTKFDCVGEKLPPGVIFIGRADYTIHAVDEQTGQERWNITVGEYVSSSSANKVPSSTRLTSNFTSNGPNTSGTDVHHAYVAGLDGTLQLVDQTSGDLKWTASLQSPVMHIQRDSIEFDAQMPSVFLREQILMLLGSSADRILVAEHDGQLFAVEQPTHHGSTPAKDYLALLPDGSTGFPLALPYPEETNPGTNGQLAPPPGVTMCSQENPHLCLLGLHPLVCEADDMEINEHGQCVYNDQFLTEGELEVKEDFWEQYSRAAWKSWRGLPRMLRYVLAFSLVGLLAFFLIKLVITFGMGSPVLLSSGASLSAKHVRSPNGKKKGKSALRRNSVGKPNNKGRKLTFSVEEDSSDDDATVVEDEEDDRDTESPSKKSANKKKLARRVKDPTEPAQTLVVVPPKSPILGPDGRLRVGKLEVVPEAILGYGSSGTIVYEGYLNGRKVAVKRMLKEFFLMAESETKLLIESDEHPNVIRYYATEDVRRLDLDSQFVYLALSHADRTLDQFIEGEQFQSLLTDDRKKDILSQLARGVSHLHSLQIVHRDLKPQNILVGGPNSTQIKISDMGLAKKLTQDRSSFSTNARGTVGWQAPEILGRQLGTSSGEGSSSSSSSSESNTTLSSTPSSDSKSPGSSSKMTKKVDIFSLGCLFYYVLTKQHPFGDRFSREKNIMDAKFALANIPADAADLISSMIDNDPAKRPDAAAVLEHSFFWGPDKKLQFLCDASNFFEFEKPTAQIVLDLEHDQNKQDVIPGRDWTAVLAPELLTDLNRFRKYNGSKLRDLLRVVRNKTQHYRDLHPDFQAELGPLPAGLLTYFLGRFPKLFPFTYAFVKANCSHDKVFKDYFDQ